MKSLIIFFLLFVNSAKSPWDGKRHSHQWQRAWCWLVTSSQWNCWLLHPVSDIRPCPPNQCFRESIHQLLQIYLPSPRGDLHSSHQVTCRQCHEFRGHHVCHDMWVLHVPPPPPHFEVNLTKKKKIFSKKKTTLKLYTNAL